MEIEFFSLNSDRPVDKGERKQDLTKELSDLAETKAKLEDELELVGKEIGSCERELYGIMSELGEQSFRNENGTFYIYQKQSFKVADDEVFKSWCKSNGFGDLYKESINYQTLQGFMSEQNVKDLPGLSVTDYATVRRKK